MESSTNEKTEQKGMSSSHNAKQNHLRQLPLFPFSDGLRSDCRATVHCWRLRRCGARNVREQDIKIRRLDCMSSRCAFIRQRVLICRVAHTAPQGRCVLCAAQSPVETWSGGCRRAPSESDVNLRANRGHRIK